MTHIRLSGLADLRIEASFERAEEIWQAALSANHLFHVLTSDGELVAVNPHQVVYIEAETENQTRAA